MSTTPSDSPRRSRSSLLSRRQLLQGSMLAAASAGLTANPPMALAEAATTQPTSLGTAKPRNVIFVVSDGMSLGVLALAEAFSWQVRGRGTRWAQLQRQQQTVHGFFDMASLNSLVTDSSAASSSWGSGSRVFNGAINLLPDGTRLTPICKVVKDAGIATGLVTTATATHATPAGFATVQDRRNDELLIAPQYRNVVDVILGGGTNFFPEALREEYRQSGYAVVTSAAELASNPSSSRLLGLFSPGHLPYVIDRRAAVQPPDLATMALAALRMLERSPRGFLLQIEGARIDHAAHNNDIAAQLWEQLAVDDALGAALDFAQARTDTLVIATTDHGNSNPGLLTIGGKENQCFARIAAAQTSFERLLSQAKGVDGLVDPANLAHLIEQQLGIQAAPEHVTRLAMALREPKDLRATTVHPQGNAPVAILGQICTNHFGVGWTGITHTSDHAILSAIGPGAGHFAGLHRNTEAFTMLTDLLNCPMKNPSMTPEDARKFALGQPALAHEYVVA